jgi:hypothetical protein
MYIFLEFCTQAKIYAIISLFILLYLIVKKSQHKHTDIIILAVQAAFFIGMTFGINKICTMGYKYFAWLIAFIPHILIILVLINYSVGEVKDTQ